MLAGTKTFIHVMQDWVSEKKTQNPRFSMRAIAQKLDCSSGYLSEVFAGRKLPTDDTLSKWANKMELSPASKKLMLALAHLQRTGQTSTESVEKLIVQTEIKERIRNRKEIKISANSGMGSPNQLLILNSLKGFQTKSAAAISAETNLPLALVTQEFRILEKQGQIKTLRDKAGQLFGMRTNTRVLMTADLNVNLKDRYSDAAKTAVNSFDHCRPDERAVGMEWIRLSSSQIGELRKKVHSFLDDVATMETDPSKPAELYQVLAMATPANRKKT